MRQAVIIHDEMLAYAFSAYLQSERIDHEVERNGKTFEIWVLREEDVAYTRQLYSYFREDQMLQAQFHNPAAAPEEDHQPGLEEPPPESEPENAEHREESPSTNRVSTHYPWTKIAILICITIYAATAWISVQNTLSNPNRIFPYWPITIRTLLYDFPPPLQMMVEFDQMYPEVQKNQWDTLDAKALEQIAKIQNTPFWVGFYRMLVYPEHAKEIWATPKFTSLKKGQIYRVITPIFLHGSILHILFNMLWLYVLGRCLEPQMGALRYLLFMGVTALVANTVEYLMTGPMFLGYSGVLSAMVGYVWVRQKFAPHEWYPIDRAILLFFMAFILGFFAIQIVLFILQYLRITAWDLGLGNAAHITGLLMGMVLARTSWFHKKIT